MSVDLHFKRETWFGDQETFLRLSIWHTRNWMCVSSITKRIVEIYSSYYANKRKRNKKKKNTKNVIWFFWLWEHDCWRATGWNRFEMRPFLLGALSQFVQLFVGAPILVVVSTRLLVPYITSCPINQHQSRLSIATLPTRANTMVQGGPTSRALLFQRTSDAQSMISHPRFRK